MHGQPDQMSLSACPSFPASFHATVAVEGNSKLNNQLLLFEEEPV